MGSGPRAGLAEIHLPDLQPGSSIMPGKVNPVIPEARLQVCAQVIGNDAASPSAGAAGNFELNVMLPVMARNLLESIRLLATCIGPVRRPVRRRHRRRRRTLPRVRRVLAVRSSPPLNRYLGYEEAAKIAKQALAERKTIREVVVERGHVERARSPWRTSTGPRRDADDPTLIASARHSEHTADPPEGKDVHR